MRNDMPIFSLVDYNNFYASCERVFNPSLEGKPIVVLSNNDGCVIARSNEAKLLNIPIGAPYFKYKKIMEQNGVKAFSSNYELYGDMSNRVMTSLEALCPDIEIYSIDEAFLILDGFLAHYDLNKYMADVREKVKQWTGIPISIGISSTKTLAKVANKIAKKNTGIFDLGCINLQNEILGSFEINDIWGIGSQLTKKLTDLNINTARELRDADSTLLRSLFSVTLERTIHELRGISCIPIEEMKPKKQIICSRSFGKPVVDLLELEEAVSHYAATACTKLRKQHSLANGITIFCHTNFFNENEPQYSKSVSYQFQEATDNTCHIISVAKEIINKVFMNGYRYKKAGIILNDLITNKNRQIDLPRIL